MDRLLSRDLIEKHLQGDKKATEELFTEIMILVQHFIKLSKLNKSDRQDLLQDSMIRIFCNIHKYDPHRGSLSTFLFWQYKASLSKFKLDKRRDVINFGKYIKKKLNIC